MCTEFRKSRFIDFNKGHVFVHPMQFARETKPPWGLAQKIDIFECRVEVWQLGVSVEILKEIERHESPSIWSHAAFGLVAVIFTYFEMIGKTLNPKSDTCGTAAGDFNHGFCDVYPGFKPLNGDYRDSSLPQVRAFRDRIRNGMYHLAGTKSNLAIHNEQNDPKFKADFVVADDGSGGDPMYFMNPHRVTRTIVDHFPGFVARLRKSESESGMLSNKFEEFFDTFHEAR